ncbi:CPBP family intramembrane glutamic endopeptidase [Sphingomonas alpina]|uniref:CPBP family intramembrane glutamic endopeptidase n=1 Tax=Sphingomonas alpina TaxID=653931 RepID=UPI0021BAC686|nr:CPBP family intramembrane glutamic endopeptidase [Sphingomonas alpina]
MTLTGSPARTLGVVAAALAAIAAWLLYAPPVAAELAGSTTGALSEAVFTVVIFGPLLAFGLAGAALSGLQAYELGQSPLRAGGRGVAIGLGGVVLATGYAALAGTLRHGAGGGLSVAFLGGAAVIALQVAAEETVFRGWLQPLLSRVMRLPVAIGGIAIAFAALHMLAGARDPLGLINLTLGGLLFGVLAARGGGIAGAFAAHFAWNAIEQLGLGLDPNPGFGSFGALIDLDLVGAVRWGGSDDGLNASWAMTIALCALLVPMLLQRSGKFGAGSASPTAHDVLSPSPHRPT